MTRFGVFLDLKDAPVTVIGGGQIALRKVSSLVASEAIVRVISPECIPPLHSLLKKTDGNWIQKSYMTGDLYGARLVFALTNDDQVNRQVVYDAKTAGIWVNAGTHADEGDLFLPAMMQQGLLQIAVSTSGVSPGYAKSIKKNLEQQFGEEWKLLLELLQDIRRIAHLALDDSKRRHILLAVTEIDLLSMIREQGIEFARKVCFEWLTTHGVDRKMIETETGKQV